MVKKKKRRRSPLGRWWKKYKAWITFVLLLIGMALVAIGVKFDI